MRVHFIIGRGARARRPIRTAPTLEAAVAGIVRTWIDGLSEALSRGLCAAPRRGRWPSAIAHAFSQGYRDAYSPLDARSTTSGSSRGCRRDRPLGVDFHRREQDRTTCIGLKVWSYERPIPLSERVPVLENMGFRVVDEETYPDRARKPRRNADVWLHDMVLERADGGAVDLDAQQAARWKPPSWW